MALIARQFESKHAVVTISVRATSTEGHSFLTDQQEHFNEALGSIVDPMADAREAARALEQLSMIDKLVDEHMKAKVG